ncbi:hypothetical protein CTEN210_02189 [Chaetoceros tenuissimus]|uniref:Dynein regulatory complex protein 1/2 N-terminal domain-containing protein n=1 Tax=Chaetoceros tenuissimus TaxID=426638 RepID=A0AAD3CIG1_9STRA|nr:hypothetical protein CTEN210_02189 [Chaetoceros tenuissimus]
MAISPPESPLESNLQKERPLIKRFRKDLVSKWEKILSKEKLQEFTLEFETLKSNQSKEWQKGRDLIDSLLRRFDNGEDNRRVAVATHLQTIDEMIQTHSKHLNHVQHRFLSKVDELKNLYEKERTEMIEKHKQNKSGIESQLDTARLAAKKRRELEIREQQQELEEIRNKNLEDINSLRFVLDAKIEDLDEQFELAKSEYLEKTDFQNESLQHELSRNDEMSMELLEIQSKLEKLNLAVKKIKRISHRKSMQNKDYFEQLMSRKTAIISKYKMTKSRMEDLRALHYSKLKELTKRANQQKILMEKELAEAENTLKLASIIKKLEDEERRNGSNTNIEERINEETLLERMNRVILDCEMIQEEESVAERKSRELKGQITKFRQGTTINDKVLLEKNTLFVVNGK